MVVGCVWEMVMTVAEAAKRIGVSASKLYQLVAARRIAHYRIDGKIVFSEEDVASYLESCHVSVCAQRTIRRPTYLKHITLKHGRPAPAESSGPG